MRSGLLVLGLLLGPLAQAAGAPLKIITIQGPPWGFVGPDKQPTGMMVEIGNRIADTAGLSYTNRLVPYPRTAFEIERGNADIVLRFGNEQMERAALAVTTIVSMPIIVVGPAGSHYQSLHELRGKTVGVVRTSKYVDAFDADAAIIKYPVNDYQVMASMIALHRIDAGIGSSAGLYYGAHMAGVKPEQLAPPLVVGSNAFILYLSKQRATPELQKTLKDAVAKLTARGEIKQIVDKYTSAYGTAPLLPASAKAR